MKSPTLHVEVIDSRTMEAKAEAHGLIEDVRELVAKHGLVDVLRAVALVSDDKPAAKKQMEKRETERRAKRKPVAAAVPVATMGVVFNLGDSVTFWKGSVRVSGVIKERNLAGVIVKTKGGAEVRITHDQAAEVRLQKA